MLAEGVILETYPYQRGNLSLNEEDTADYKCYIQRRNDRRDTARRADKLVAMCGSRAADLRGEIPVEGSGPPFPSQASVQGNHGEGRHGGTKCSHRQHGES